MGGSETFYSDPEPDLNRYLTECGEQIFNIKAFLFPCNVFELSLFGQDMDSDPDPPHCGWVYR